MTRGTPREAGLTVDLLGYTHALGRARLVHAIDPRTPDRLAACGAGRIRTRVATGAGDANDPRECPDCWAPVD